MRRDYFFTLLAGCFTAVCCLAAPGELAKRIDEVVEAEMRVQKIPGVAVAVINHGEIISARGYGLANVEHAVPVNPETIFQSGSVGKQFTAVLIMLLVQDGRVALDDPVTKWFCDAPSSWKLITVQSLLNHTSGISDYEKSGFDLQRNYSETELAQRAMGLSISFPAGVRWSYSNTNYLLLGLIAERATGLKFGELMRDRVFLPAGMKTAQIINEADIIPHRAAGYRIEKEVLKNQEWVAPTLNQTGDGCLYFSLNDMMAWDRAWRKKALLTAESWSLMLAPTRLKSGKTYPYGFGINLFEEAGQMVQRHSGGWQGFKAFRAYYTQDDFSVTVLTNLAQASPDRIGDKIGSLLVSKSANSPEPIPSPEPTVAAIVTRLLASASEDKLSAKELAYVDEEFFPAQASALAKRLQGLGAPTELFLTERYELGDDVFYRFEVKWSGQKSVVRLGLAPDGKVSLFSVR